MKSLFYTSHHIISTLFNIIYNLIYRFEALIIFLFSSRNWMEMDEIRWWPPNWPTYSSGWLNQQWLSIAGKLIPTRWCSQFELAEFPSLYQYNTSPNNRNTYIYIYIYTNNIYIYICMYVYIYVHIPNFIFLFTLWWWYINPNPHSYWISKPAQLWLHQKVHVTTHAPRHRRGENATAKSWT